MHGAGQATVRAVSQRLGLHNEHAHSSVHDCTRGLTSSAPRPMRARPACSARAASSMR